MKFSERFFRFPIRVYDGVSIRRVMKQEMALDSEQEPDIPAWAAGIACLPFWALEGLYFYDSFSPGRSVSDVGTRGHDMTSIYHRDLGDFECTWKRDKFEEKLDEFVERYTKESKKKVATRAKPKAK